MMPTYDTSKTTYLNVQVNIYPLWVVSIELVLHGKETSFHVKVLLFFMHKRIIYKVDLSKVALNLCKDLILLVRAFESYGFNSQTIKRNIYHLFSAQ